MDELKILMQIGELEDKFRDLESEQQRNEERDREFREKLEEIQRESMAAFADLSLRFKVLEEKQSV